MRTALGALLCACGIVVLIAATVRNGRRWHWQGTAEGWAFAGVALMLLGGWLLGWLPGHGRGSG